MKHDSGALIVLLLLLCALGLDVITFFLSFIVSISERA